MSSRERRTEKAISGESKRLFSNANSSEVRLPRVRRALNTIKNKRDHATEWVIAQFWD